jgi:uncharacterized protein YodC (DUF2158 family)
MPEACKWLMTNSDQTDAPRFRIGQNVRLKSGGPVMIVNHCALGLDGKFVVDTIWFDVTVDGRKAEASGTYKEALLDTNESTLYKKARLG